MSRLLPALALALFTVLAPSTSYAQTTTAETTSWEVSLPVVLAEELSSSDANRRTDAMLQVIHYGRFGDGTIHWTPVVEPLLSIFQNDPKEQSRMIAVAALSATDDPRGMSQLRQLTPDQTSARAARSAIDALVEFYGIESFENDRQMARVAERSQASSAITPKIAQGDVPDKQ